MLVWAIKVNKELALLGAGLLFLGAQVWLLYFGPVEIEHRGEEAVYTHRTFYPLLFNGLVLVIGARFFWKHVQGYGWRRTFLTGTDRWAPEMRASFAGALLFFLALAALALTLWQSFEAKFVVVSPAGLAEGLGSGPEATLSKTVDFARLESIDFHYYEAQGQRRKWCLRCLDRAGGEQVFLRDSLLNAAAPRIAQEAERAGVKLLNY